MATGVQDVKILTDVSGDIILRAKFQGI